MWDYPLPLPLLHWHCLALQIPLKVSKQNWIFLCVQIHGVDSQRGPGSEDVQLLKQVEAKGIYELECLRKRAV